MKKSPLKILMALMLVCLGIFPVLQNSQAQRSAEASLRVGDSFELRLAGVPANDVAMVSGMFTVNNDGTINLPHIGKVKAAGFGPAQLQSAVESAYKSAQIYTNPTVTVSVTTTARFVNIGGDVRSPQRIPHTADMTILTAINSAGGFTEYADQRKVRLMRGSDVYVVDYKKILQDPKADIPLQPGDQIQVPRSMW